MKSSREKARRPLRSSGGFTLVEMAIVILIITIVAAVVTRALPFIADRVRDNKRLYELSNLQRAIEIYHSDTGSYPNTPSGPGFITFATTNDASLGTLPVPTQITPQYLPNMVPTYFQALPQDPAPGASNNTGCQALGYNRNIIYISNGDYYKLIFQCASETNDYDSTNWYYDPNRFNWGWAVSNDINYTSGTLGW
jgi:prepilin-type N-terminal cleavage/methylation domain-containing protein